MRGGKQLLLLAVLVLLARCQQTPQVSMSPKLKDIFSGDLFYLNCDNGTSGDAVKWYVNNEAQELSNKTWKVAVASPMNSGSYHCESNGQKSEIFPIAIKEYIPIASLTIKTGQPVMQTGSSVVLQLENEDGLQGWNCWVDRGGQMKKIKLRLEKNDTSKDFQPKKLTFPETIFWCTDSAELRRSNQITIRTSDKDVALEMYPLPVVEGESLTLKCLAWGTDQISHTVFYKNGAKFLESKSPTYKISAMSESERGTYKCYATFTYKARTNGPPYQVVSDNQDVFVQVPPMQPVLTANIGLSCSCSLCPGNTSYRWYYKDDDGQPWKLKNSSSNYFTMPKESGAYACRAVWYNGRSLLSNRYVYKSPIKSILIVLILLVILVLAAAVFYIWYKKRNTTGPIYEDVALRGLGDDKYEALQNPGGARREGEYDTLHPEAPSRVKKEGEYEPLKKEEMKEGVYHTLGMEGAAGGEGGYEALKKEGMKEGVYNTLGMEGAAGGEGGYEALKKEGMKEGVYNTLGVEGAAGGEGGYQALKKEGMKEGVYHTLGMEGAGGGEGGHKAVEKKDKDIVEVVEEKK